MEDNAEVFNFPTKRLNAERVKEARGIRKLDELELAELLDIKLDEVLKCEANLESELDTIVGKLASVLEFPVKYFHESSLIHVKTGTTFFRLSAYSALKRKPKCDICGRPNAEFLCDNYLTVDTVCSKSICEQCRVQVDGYKDYCKECYKSKKDI